MTTPQNPKKSLLQLVEDIFAKADFTVLILLILVVMVLWIGVGSALYYVHHLDPSYFGTLGDTLGILNSFFSTLAFAGVIYSIFQQNKVIKRQEDEIVDNKTEARIDRFESNFFQMLAAQREIVNEIDLKKKIKKGDLITRTVTTKGRECFRVIYNQAFYSLLRKYYKEEYGRLPADKRNLYRLLSLKEIVFVYENELFPKYQDDLGHYFRHLYRIVRLVDKVDFIKDKSEYIGILRAQLSMYELLLLYYNGLSQHGKKFKPLIEKHKILKSMHDGYLINGSDDMHDPKSYELTAFGQKGKKISSELLG